MAHICFTAALSWAHHISAWCMSLVCDVVVCVMQPCWYCKSVNACLTCWCMLWAVNACLTCWYMLWAVNACSLVDTCCEQWMHVHLFMHAVSSVRGTADIALHFQHTAIPLCNNCFCSQKNCPYIELFLLRTTIANRTHWLVPIFFVLTLRLCLHRVSLHWEVTALYASVSFSTLLPTSQVQ